MNVILTVDKIHTAPQMTLDCGPGLKGLNEVDGPNHRKVLEPVCPKRP